MRIILVTFNIKIKMRMRQKVQTTAVYFPHLHCTCIITIYRVFDGMLNSITLNKTSASFAITFMTKQ